MHRLLRVVGRFGEATESNCALVNRRAEFSDRAREHFERGEIGLPRTRRQRIGRGSKISVQVFRCVVVSRSW